MHRINYTAAKRSFDHHFNSVSYGGETICVERKGQKGVVMMPAELLEDLEAFNDWADSVRGIITRGNPADDVSLEDLRAELEEGEAA